jgi:hypothetical protein
MANLHIAQIEYLSQELSEHVKNVNNLIARGKFELDLVQQTLRTLVTVVLEKELDAD